MDTGTHIVMGIALGGISTLDPVVANSAPTGTAVLIAAILGSQAPDIDTVLKLKNNATYLKHHRGITHSIPAVLLWPIAITVAMMLFFPEANWFHIWIWTFLAVFLHVFVDIFNAYGTQALRPFSSKWVALGWINTFDPFIFGIHIVGFILWFLGAHPGYTFLAIYGIIVAYYVLRFISQRNIRRTIEKRFPEVTNVIIAPTLRYYQWRVAIMDHDHFYVGRAFKDELIIFDQFERLPFPEEKEHVLSAVQDDPNVSAFLNFSPSYRWEMEEEGDKIEIRFIDLRYRKDGHYPFVAIVHLDWDLNIISSFTGWVYSEEKLQKKLEILPD
ncbi:metal-dependent hydrolase [Bacillus carboniphilus]|uniref:Metal-dependent hydrolase n=1 Tax=Bacillus carboniphilus TaxID=86663 RepID=A0ABP3GBM1_9BACI